ncbi:hypothetical protein [Enterococcus casseliflavus]|uniref:hypothetical protein n=1 Tax=Enterococcus casseliflavus TaxID=37734 RepID=UPI002955521C|nr:hypothetical protein [Enterococcus casseliflavus]MDV7751729.1 hypothetical protein [Enterococcus casseliflavus]
MKDREKPISLLDLLNMGQAEEAKVPKEEKIAKRVRSIHQMAHDNFSSEVTIQDFQYDLNNEIEWLADLLEIKL